MYDVKSQARHENPQHKNQEKAVWRRADNRDLKQHDAVKKKGQPDY